MHSMTPACFLAARSLRARHGLPALPPTVCGLGTALLAVGQQQPHRLEDVLQGAALDGQAQHREEESSLVSRPVLLLLLLLLLAAVPLPQEPPQHAVEQVDDVARRPCTPTVMPRFD